MRDSANGRNGAVETLAFLGEQGFRASGEGQIPASAKRFPDGAQYRVEIPSVEGPACLAAVEEEAERLGVTVHRASQGSGVFLHTDDELDEMVRIAAAAPLEVSLFARPGAAWVISPTARVHAGFGGAAFGLEGVAANLDDCRRAADHGFRSVLIGDVGVLDVFGRARSAGLLPQDMQAKVSVMLPASNPASAALLSGSAPRRSTSRPTSRSRRSPRSGPPSRFPLTSTSSRRTTSAAISAITRFPS
jgi:hypothetical protein